MTAILKEDPPELSRHRPECPARPRAHRAPLPREEPREIASTRRTTCAFALEALSGLSAPSGAPAAAKAPRKRRPIFVGAVLLAAAGALAIAFWVGRGTSRRRRGAAPAYFPPADFPARVDHRSAFRAGRQDDRLQRLLRREAERTLPGAGGRRGAEVARHLEQPRARRVPQRRDCPEPPQGAEPALVREGNARPSASPRRCAASDHGKRVRRRLEPGGKGSRHRARGRGKARLEFPAGTKLDETSLDFISPRVSPDGRSVAYVRTGRDSDAIVLADRSG